MFNQMVRTNFFFKTNLFLNKISNFLANIYYYLLQLIISTWSIKQITNQL